MRLMEKKQVAREMKWTKKKEKKKPLKVCEQIAIASKLMASGKKDSKYTVAH